MDSERLLIVDDEEPILFAMTRYFACKGWVVDRARELEEAEALLANVTYAVVIADLRLTADDGQEGLDIIRFVRERCPRTKVLLLTAYGSPRAEREAKRLGADAFLQKPQPLHELARVVETLRGASA